jgi:hypothetical protein
MQAGEPRSQTFAESSDGAIGRPSREAPGPTPFLQEAASMRWADVIQNEPPVETSPAIPSAHRVGLRIVSLYFIFPAATSMLFMFLIQTGALPLPPEQRDIIDHSPIWQSIVFYIIMALNLAGGGLLLSRYRIALPVLLLSAGINVVNLVYLAAKG